MQRRLKRAIGALLLGLALTFGISVGGQVVGTGGATLASDPGNGSGGHGG